MRDILVTGGAGFIGRYVSSLLLERGKRVRVLDNLDPQVHGEDAGTAAGDVEFQRGDVRDLAAVERALDGIDAVVHLASSVGVGQSMYQIADYVAVNDLGTANLLQALSQRPVQALVLASSMSIYGEGRYQAPDGQEVDNAERTLEQLKQGQWEPQGEGGAALTPVATPESKPPVLSSIYAINKFAQERMSLVFGRAYNVPTTALRFFNVYGAGQALSNPYTGVLAIFAARLLNGESPMIFEDGEQRRDFVHVRDVARACVQALERPEAAGRAYNIGSGQPRTVTSIAHDLARAVGQDKEPAISGRFRFGDIRHCFADLALSRTMLGFEPQEDWNAGLTELAGWLASQTAQDRVEHATGELMRRGLVA